MASKTISILGCGWLGMPLAKYLLQQGYFVKGSTTQEKKLKVFKKEGIEPFLLRFNPQLLDKEGGGRTFFQSDILFLNIPFKRTLEDPQYYYEQNLNVLKAVESSPVKFVIFASSTSVYPRGIKVAYEDMALVPDNLRAKVLRETEQLFLNNKNFKTVIVRFAGLYGPQRPIGHFLKEKEFLKDGNSPVNFIHLEDCVQILTRIIEEDLTGEILNASSDQHPTRQQLYTQVAIQLGLKPPVFVNKENSLGKIVSNQKLKERLNYRFKYPDPLQI